MEKVFQMNNILLYEKLKLGKGKFEGKLPLICFGCGEVGNFASKFPNRSDGNSKGKKGFNKFNKKGFKRNFLSKEDSYPMKTMTVKKKPMRQYCLWPSTINKRYQITKKKG